LGLHQFPLAFDLQSLFPGDRLLRLHPNWFVSGFEQDQSSFTVTIKDYVTDDEFLLSGSFLFNANKTELLHIQLIDPIDTKISFLTRDGKLLVQIYTHEKINADDPLLLWIRAIKEYIRIYLKKTPGTLFFRFLMNKVLLKMDPSQRKISLMIAKITAVEILVILLIVIAYVIFVL